MLQFLTKSQSLNIIPSYVNKRTDYLSHDNRYSAILVEEKKIDEHYKSFSNAHPMAALFCNKLIKAILIAELDSYIEGTTADGLGIAHIDFKEHFNQEDFNELIIHQITHMLLFIDDFIEPQEPANQYRFTLKENDLLMMDNCQVLHGRTAFNEQDDRLLLRFWNESISQ